MKIKMIFLRACDFEIAEQEMKMKQTLGIWYMASKRENRFTFNGTCMS